MNHIVHYKIFETLQEADKIISKMYEKPQYWEYYKKEVIKNGLQNYLGWLAKNIDELWYFQLSDIIDLIKWIKVNKISTDDKTITNLKDEYDQYLRLKPFKKFVNKWCPSSLRSNDTHIKLFDKLTPIFTHSFENRLELLDQDKINTLKRGSICKNIEEWLDLVHVIFDYTKFNVDKLKSSDGIKIHFEDDICIIFESKSYEAYISNLISPNWCLLSKGMYDGYHKSNNTFLIYVYKGEIKKSLIFTIKDDKIKMCNDWTNKIANPSDEVLDKVNNIIGESKTFESTINDLQSWINEVMQNCKDIMLELEDRGLTTDVRRSLYMEGINSVIVDCTMSLNSSSPNKWRKVGLIEIYDRLSDYMKSEGFDEIDRITNISDFTTKNGKSQARISFKKSNLNGDYIGNLRYLKRYNLE